MVLVVTFLVHTKNPHLCLAIIALSGTVVSPPAYIDSQYFFLYKRNSIWFEIITYMNLFHIPQIYANQTISYMNIRTSIFKIFN